MKRRDCLISLGVLPWLWQPSLAGQRPVLKPHRAEFRLRLNRIPVGRMERELTQRSGGLWVYRSEARTTGAAAALRDDRITERVMLEEHDGRLRPIAYFMRQRGRRERREQLGFNWAEGTVENSAGDDWRLEDIPDDLLDELGAQVVLIMDLHGGARGELSYNVADDGEVKTYRFRAEDMETVATGLGEYEALKVERIREDSDRYTAFWSAPELDFWPVKVEQRESASTRMVMTLESLEYTE